MQSLFEPKGPRWQNSRKNMKMSDCPFVERQTLYSSGATDGNTLFVRIAGGLVNLSTTERNPRAALCV
jgi:hypothetical protein